MYTLGKRSLNTMTGINTKLADVVRKAIEITKQDFTVVEGLRTVERQRELVKQGFSKTMNSKHITGHAVDLYPYYSGKVQVNAPKSKFKEISEAMKEAAKELGVKITWGGDWKSFVDMPHYQIEK